ncbi:MAG: hypothetical protein LBE89_05475 [Helicobacteraceae bacterium]|jgi:ABC-type phosphate transport system auxiliary subunit|nr:hypothetical protein [Helicobacteraceae bacterium]
MALNNTPEDDAKSRTKEVFETISNWTWDNAAAVIAIAIAAALGSIAGLAAGIAIFFFINYIQSKA